MTIWTGGAHNHIHRALPILFTWWILANITTTLTHFRACRLACELDVEQGADKKDVEADLPIVVERHDSMTEEKKTMLTTTIRIHE